MNDPGHILLSFHLRNIHHHNKALKESWNKYECSFYTHLFGFYFISPSKNRSVISLLPSLELSPWKSSACPHHSEHWEHVFMSTCWGRAHFCYPVLSSAVTAQPATRQVSLALGSNSICHSSPFLTLLSSWMPRCHCAIPLSGTQTQRPLEMHNELKWPWPGLKYTRIPKEPECSLYSWYTDSWRFSI